MRDARKAKFGQYFTIEPIAEFMVSLITKPREATILEPSSGKGVFLHALQKQHFFNIEAFEIDPSLSDGFNQTRHESFISSPISEKFDCIIGNPPYIRWKNLEPQLKEELAQSRIWNTYFNSLCDYLFIFILKSIEQLKDNGELIFICTDYWLNTTHAQTLRNYMLDHGYFESIYHFNEAPLFENVSASFIIFKFIKSPNFSPKKIRLYEYNSKQKPTLDFLKSKNSFEKKDIPSFHKNGRWILESADKQEKISLLEKACVRHDNFLKNTFFRIGDVCDIGNGMVSGLDKAFDLSKTQLNAEEVSQTIQVVKAKNIQPYFFQETSTYLFPQEHIPFSSFERKYPKISAHLHTYLNELDKRYAYGKPLEPHQFAFPRNKQLLERKCQRIFVPCKDRITQRKRFRFCLANPGIYALQDVTAIIPKTCMKESIYYLLGFLNTEDVYLWLYYNGIKKGDVVEFSETPTASIPYRPIDWSNQKEVETHNSIVLDVKSYINTRQPQYLSSIADNFKSLFRGIY